jgi:hypothetical protein
VDKHLESVIDKAGRIDISFDAIGIADKDVVVRNNIHPIKEQSVGKDDAFAQQTVNNGDGTITGF